MKEGFAILEMNRTCGHHGELDIVARKNDLLLFIEVKSATKEQMGGLSLKVDEQKKQKLHDAIHHYIQKENPEFKDIRLDVSTVFFGKGKPKIEFFRGVE